MPTYQSQVLDHLGLVAGMFNALRIGEVIDRALPQDLPKRTVSLGQAVKAMVRNGLGCVNQQLSLGPSFFQTKPTERLVGLGIPAPHLNDDVLGRALDALSSFGVTPLYSLIAAEAATRLGIVAQYAHLDTTSFHVDGRYNSAEEPDTTVMHVTQGSSRTHRLARNQVMRELIVEHHAGMPVLMQPLSGHTNDSVECGRVVPAHVQQLRTAHHVTSLVADSALDNAENLGHLAQSGVQWITRVPATLSEVQTVLARINPETMAPLTDGYRYCEEASTYGEITQRWVVVYSEARRERGSRTVEKQGRSQSKAERKAFTPLCRMTFACTEEARQVLETFTHSLQATRLEGGLGCTVPRYGQRGRPPPGASPPKGEDKIEGVLASSLAFRQTLLGAKSCCIVATNACDATARPATESWSGSKGQSTPERGAAVSKPRGFSPRRCL